MNKPLPGLATAIHGRPRGYIEWTPQAKTRALIEQVQAVETEREERRALVAWLKEKPVPHDMT